MTAAGKWKPQPPGWQRLEVSVRAETAKPQRRTQAAQQQQGSAERGVLPSTTGLPDGCSSNVCQGDVEPCCGRTQTQRRKREAKGALREPKS